jgi:hypothetical protein
MRWAEHAARMVNWRGVYSVWWGNLRDRHHLEFPVVDEMIILKLIFRKWDSGMYWIDLAYDRDRWRAVVQAVMNIRFP